LRHAAAQHNARARDASALNVAHYFFLVPPTHHRTHLGLRIDARTHLQRPHGSYQLSTRLSCTDASTMTRLVAVQRCPAWPKGSAEQGRHNQIKIGICKHHRGVLAPISVCRRTLRPASLRERPRPLRWSR